MSDHPEITDHYTEEITDPGFLVSEQGALFNEDPYETAPEDYQPVIPQEDDAIDVVGIGSESKEKKKKINEMNEREFGMQLNKLLLDESVKKHKKYQEIREFISGKGQLIYKDLSELKPSIGMLSARISLIINSLNSEFKADINFPEDELTEKIYEAFHLIWAKPIEPYILNYLLRRGSIKSLDLLRVWKDSIQIKTSTVIKKPQERDSQLTFLMRETQKKTITDDDKDLWLGNEYTEGKVYKQNKSEAQMKEFRAVEELKQYAFKANKFAALFSHNGSGNYFCKEIYETNDIRELQKIVAEENGFSHESWEKKHHAYIKISLIYAILMVDGKVQPKRIEFISNRLMQKIKSICFRYGIDPDTKEPIYILNPKRNSDGTLSESEHSIIINDIHINTKHDFSLLLKFIMKVLSDSIAPSIDNIRDLIRGRIMMIKDPRKAHSEFIEKKLTIKDAEAACATRILGILMGVIGTSVDKRNIRYSIEDGEPISENGTGNRVRRALQVKFFPMFDSDENGEISAAGQTHPVEWQIVCFIPPEDHQADIDEYIEKKRNAAEMQLGVVSFKENYLDMCEVLINQYGFPNHDSPKQRKLRENAFGSKSRKKPFMQELVASKIVEGVLADTEKTQQDIKEMLSDPVSRKIIEDAFVKIGAGMYSWTFYHLQTYVKEFIDMCKYNFGPDCGYTAIFTQILGLMKEGCQSPSVMNDILNKLKEVKQSFIYYARDIFPNNPAKVQEMEFHLDALLYVFETGPDQILARYQLSNKKLKRLCKQIDTEVSKQNTNPLLVAVPES